jgi:hypothetical protein
MRLIDWIYRNRINRLQRRSLFYWNKNSMCVANGDIRNAVKYGRKAILLDCKINKIQGEIYQ